MVQGEPWHECQVRFLASSRADQTPLGVLIDGRWLDVILKSESVEAALEPTAAPLRCFRVQTKDRCLIDLRPDRHGKWYFRVI